MLNWFAKRWLDKFERDWDYDVSYMHRILEAGGIGAMMPMNGLQKIASYSGGCPIEVLSTARIVASRAGDCGPCLQLTVKMAERAGMQAEQIRAVLTQDVEAMNKNVGLVYDFTRAVLARDGWDAPLRDEIVQRFGARALIAISYSIALAGFYPAFKYAYGAGHACSRIRVGSTEVAPLPV